MNSYNNFYYKYLKYKKKYLELQEGAGFENDVKLITNKPLPIITKYFPELLLDNKKEKMEELENFEYLLSTGFIKSTNKPIGKSIDENLAKLLKYKNLIICNDYFIDGINLILSPGFDLLKEYFPEILTEKNYTKLEQFEKFANLLTTQINLAKILKYKNLIICNTYLVSSISNVILARDLI